MRRVLEDVLVSVVKCHHTTIAVLSQSRGLLVAVISSQGCDTISALYVHASELGRGYWPNVVGSRLMCPLVTWGTQ